MKKLMYIVIISAPHQHVQVFIIWSLVHFANFAHILEPFSDHFLVSNTKKASRLECGRLFLYKSEDTQAHVNLGMGPFLPLIYKPCNIQFDQWGSGASNSKVEAAKSVTPP